MRLSLRRSRRNPTRSLQEASTTALWLQLWRFWLPWRLPQPLGRTARASRCRLDEGCWGGGSPLWDGSGGCDRRLRRHSFGQTWPYEGGRGIRHLSPERWPVLCCSTLASGDACHIACSGPSAMGFSVSVAVGQWWRQRRRTQWQETRRSQPGPSTATSQAKSGPD